MESPNYSNYCVYLFLMLTACDGLSNVIQNVKAKGPTITRLHIRSDILYRFATTTVFSTVANDDMESHETTFDVTLPEAAFITNCTLEIDGIIYPGVVKEKEAAQRQYDTAKKKGHSAGHIAAKPRDTNRFKVSVNVASKSRIHFTLSYNELLRRRRGSYDHTIYIRPRQIVEDFRVEVYIQESRQITYLRVPPLRDNDLIQYNSIEQNRLAVVTRPSSASAYIKYEPSPNEQRRVSEQGLSGLFVVKYDVDRRLDAGDVLVLNGYFVHFFAPEGLNRRKRNILFILDTSGSMQDTKLRQLQEAMVKILDDLQKDDIFNIVCFNSNVRKWREVAVPATPTFIQKAKKYIGRLVADGWTDINSALIEGIESITANVSEEAAPIVVFLTDGDPTYGITDHSQILNNVMNQNVKNVPVFALSFGEGADFGFLRKISAQNDGFARKIYEASDATLQLTNFYNEISSVLVSNVTFQYLEDTVIKNTVTNVIFPNYFEGSEIVIAGQLEDNSINNIVTTVYGNGADGQISLSNTGNVFSNEVTDNYDIPEALNFTTMAERIWSYITIKQMLRQMFTEKNQTVADELKKKIIALALEYSFVTPLTSMVVTKPEKQEMSDSSDEEKKISEWKRKAAPGAALAGKSASFVDNDPHFIVHVKGLDSSICFDVMGKSGDILSLVKDHISGITVTAVVISSKANPKKKSRRKRKESKNKQTATKDDDLKTYLGEIRIFSRRSNMSFTPEFWSVDGKKRPWRSSVAVTSFRIKIVTDGSGQMIAVIFPNKITLLIMRHMRSRSQMRAGKVPFLGFYIVDNRGFSWHTHGLLGQFLHRRITLEKKRKAKGGKIRGKLIIRGNVHKQRRLVATLGSRMNLATNTQTTCWMVQKNGKKLIDGNYMNYITRGNNSTVETKRQKQRTSA